MQKTALFIKLLPTFLTHGEIVRFTTKTLFLIASFNLIGLSLFADSSPQNISFDSQIQLVTEASEKPLSANPLDSQEEIKQQEIDLANEPSASETPELQEVFQPASPIQEAITPPQEAKLDIAMPRDKRPESRILARYYSAEAIQALPRLKSLAAVEPEYNKMILKIEGYPKNQEIFFEEKRLASANPESYEKKMSFSIQNDGTMLITNTDQHLLSLVCSSRGYLPGEPVTFRFRTADNKFNNEISGTPTPAIIRDKDLHIALKAELLSYEPTVYNITLPSMKEGEEFEIKATSVNEIVRGKSTYKKDMPPLHYAPTAKGKKGGDAIFEIHKKTGEVYTILLPWGSALNGYLHGDKVYSAIP